METRTRTNVGQFERHIERKNESYENMNVDLSRSSMNVRFKGCDGMTYNEHLDQLIEQGKVSLRGLKDNATVFDEMILDVNTEYFKLNGGYEFACKFYEEAYHFAEQLYGKDNIVSAVMHADELNTAMTEKYSKPVYHYHLHVMALPVVDKEIKWTKRCKDPALIGTVKEVIHQVSHSKKWKSEAAMDENGQPILNKNGKQVYRASYSILQDKFFEHMKSAGFADVERGERGSTAEHLTVTEFKVEQEQQRLATLEALTEEAKDALSAKEFELNLLTKEVKNVEKLVAKYCADPGTILLKADLFESGKAYRENKAMPVVRKLQALLTNVYVQWTKAKQEIHRLMQAFHNEKKANERLLDRIGLLETENKQFGIVKKVLGMDVINRALEQERAERQVHKATRKHDDVLR